MKKLHVQYGAGFCAPEEWVNFDSSPSIRVQNLPFIGSLLRKGFKTHFPKNVSYGNIIKGLPISENSCDGLYCSHVLEHINFKDFHFAISNSYKILKPGGLFRCVVPDLESYAREYISNLDKGDSGASILFMKKTLLGEQAKPKGIKRKIIHTFESNEHLWMWDFQSMSEALKKAGFINVRKCSFNDSVDEMFKLVEDEDRFNRAVAIECSK